MIKKPSKPHRDFPLYSHASGQWAKKIRQRIHYFGPWHDPQAALNNFLRVKDDLLAGRTPGSGDELTVRELCNSFLNSKQRLVASGEIKESTFRDYHDMCRRVVKVFGVGAQISSLRPIDFENLRADFAKTHGPSTLAGDIACTRVLFRYAEESFGVKVNYGQSFRKPSRGVMRRHRQRGARRMFQADELREIIEAAPLQLRAMIYLGLNCGFGNHDCAMLPVSALNLDRGWVEFARPKTGIYRRCPLWPETVFALRAVLAKRPNPRDSSTVGRVFITKYGFSWEPKSVKDSPISNEFAKLLKKCGRYQKGVGFYALRHVFQTIGEKSRDKDAVRAIMGHAEAAGDMSAIYNEEPVEDDRLLAVTKYVRNWLLMSIAKMQPARA